MGRKGRSLYRGKKIEKKRRKIGKESHEAGRQCNIATSRVLFCRTWENRAKKNKNRNTSPQLCHKKTSFRAEEKKKPWLRLGGQRDWATMKGLIQLKRGRESLRGDEDLRIVEKLKVDEA